MNVRVKRLKRFEAESGLKAFADVELYMDTYKITIEGLIVKEIVKEGTPKLIVAMPQYKTSKTNEDGTKEDAWRDTVYIEGKLWWEVYNRVLAEYN